MNVLSLFDGMSCGQIALEKAGIKVDNYFASEIDKNSIFITQKNYPKTKQIGDITNLTDQQLNEIGKIDLLIGGSPCQNLSITVIDREEHNQGLEGEKSKLFYEYVRVLETVKPNYFLYENVGSMKDKDRDIITQYLGVQPILIDSNLVSAQDRKRYYWTNIQGVEQPEDKGIILKDILESHVDDKYFYHDREFTYHGEDKKIEATLHVNTHEMLKRVYNHNDKCGTLTACRGGYTQKKVLDKGKVRKLTPVEYERLQTVPMNEYRIEVELCEESAKNFVNVVESNHTVQKSVLNAEKELLKEFARLVEKNMKQKNLKIKSIVQQNVDTQIQKQTKKCTSQNQEEKYLNVDIVEKKMTYNNQELEEVFATKNVFINITEGKITLVGKEELHQKDKSYIIQRNGNDVLKLFGKEIMQLVKDAEKNSLMKKGNNFTSTILNHLSTKSVEKILIICYLYAKNVIDGYTVQKISIPNLSIIVNEGYTAGVAESHRYNMLGDGWTIDVIAHIFNGLN